MQHEYAFSTWSDYSYYCETPHAPAVPVCISKDLLFIFKICRCRYTYNSGVTVFQLGSVLVNARVDFDVTEAVYCGTKMHVKGAVLFMTLQMKVV